eukprot:CCRYP_002648-RA/>CCRYP_002648-RA protein AED:0.36 eAED:0.36 QI:0/0/0/1/0/0/2/0/381
MRLKLSDIPDHIIKLYKLDKLVTTDGYVYVLIQKECTVSHRRASSLNNSLKKGYRQSSITPGFWKHDWRPISFTLCVGDLIVKYVGIKHAQHLLQTLNEHYESVTRLEGWRYLGLTIAWDYTLQQVQLSMPGYCKKPATVFTTLFPSNHSINPILIHPALMAPNNSLSTLRMTQRYSPTPTKNSSRKSSASSCTTHELWTAPCYLHWGPLPQQSAPTQNTMSKIHQFLDYAMTHPGAMITYRASNMILAVHSGASYLSETKARSRAGDIFPIRRRSVPRNNGAILTLAQIIKPVMSSAAEAKLGALYINARETIPQRHLLNELGHPQPPTPIQIDNSTALGWSPTSSNPNAPKQWTCVFIGSVVEKIKNSFAPIGAQEPLT